MTAGHASAGEPASALPGSLRTNPRLSRWLHFASDGTVEITPGKVEIGQGILTALAQIAADELDVDLAAIRLKPAATGSSPNEGVTSGSLSVHDCGLAVRTACAAARGLFLAAAAARLGVPAEALAVENGTIAGPGNARIELCRAVRARVPRRRPRGAGSGEGPGSAPALRDARGPARHPRQGLRHGRASSTTSASTAWSTAASSGRPPPRRGLCPWTKPPHRTFRASSR